MTLTVDLVPAKWLKPGAVVPVTPETVSILLRALSRLSAEGWQPIEEAPTDGTPLMGCTWIEGLPHLYSPRRIYWAAYHPNATGKECWRDAPTCGNKLERLTHFRPLIAPPAMLESEVKT